MNIFIIKYLLIFLLLFSCKKNTGQCTKASSENPDKAEHYKPIKLIVHKSYSGEDLTVYELKNNSIPLNLFILKNQYSYVKVNDKIIKFPLEFEFIDTADLKTINEIFLFKKDKEYLILVPTYSESFTTFIMLEFSENGKFAYKGNHTYNQEVFNKLKNLPFQDRVYVIKEDKTGEPKIYLKNGDEDLIFSEVLFSEPILKINKDLEKVASFQKKQSKNTSDDYLLFQKELLNQFLLNNITAENVLTTDSKNKIVKIVNQFFSAEDFNTAVFHKRMSAGSDSKKFQEMFPIWKNVLLQLDFDAIILHDDVPNWKYPFDEISSLQPVMNLYKNIPTNTATDLPFYHMTLYATLLSWNERKIIFEEVNTLKSKIKDEGVK